MDALPNAQPGLPEVFMKVEEGGGKEACEYIRRTDSAKKKGFTNVFERVNALGKNEKQSKINQKSITATGEQTVIRNSPNEEESLSTPPERRALDITRHAKTLRQGTRA